jgi:hypothetical protein
MALTTCVFKTLFFNGGAITSNIGTNIIMSTIKATTSSISNIIGYITNDSSKDMTHITKFLREIDLQFTIVTMQSFIIEQNTENIPMSVSNALEGVNDILKLINDDLQSIKNEYENHRNKYFSSYRNFTWSGNMNEVKCHNDILKHRYDILFELLKVYGKKQ